MESIQISYDVKSYFRDPFNIIEMVQIGVNITLICQLYTETKLTGNFAVIIVFVTMVKFLFSLRAFNNMGMLVRLIFRCVTATLPFVSYLIIWISFFEYLMGILEATVGTPIKGMGVNYSNYIQLFRTSVGDI